MFMKPAIGKSQEGSVLVMTVVMCALIGSVLCSYLVLISGRNERAMRALAWNGAIPVLEAGFEEALTHLQDDKGNPKANGWTVDLVDGHPAYWKYRVLPDGSYFYVTNFDVSSFSPTIISAGYVRSPLRDKEYISRVVRLTTTNPPSVFSHAIAASGLVKLSGSAIVDGYSSAAGPYSATNRNANGSVATDSQLQKAIDIGSAHIYGQAVTGPGGSVSVANGSVGDLNQSSGIQSGWTNDDMNVSFQDNAPPTGHFIAPMPTQVGISNVTILSSNSSQDVYKVAGSLVSSSENRPIIVTGNATLWVTGDFIVNGTGYVYIAPGASLTLYVGGMGSISGGGVVNGSGLPSNFSYNGLPSSTSLFYSGSGDFVGTINAPEASVRISGGASVFGAVICNTFTSSGGSGVHYDQALRGGGIFMVTGWTEL
jgi:hypothetical protein